MKIKKKDNKKEKSIKREIIEAVLIILVIFSFRFFVFSPVEVVGESMMPTLESGDRGWSIKIAPIHRFDIVNFHSPVEEGKDYVKRVIGVPGDNVEYKNDQLYINGKKYDEPYLDEYKSKLEDDSVLTEDYSMEETLGISEIPEGKYLVMGDNRRNSFDGRKFGLIEKEAIIGDVKFIYWPLKDLGFVE